MAAALIVAQPAVPSTPPETFALRRPCRWCGGYDGRLEHRNGQACAFCTQCGQFQYNVPRGELGLEPRAVSLHGIPASLRARILERATARCELCGAAGILHVSHLLSVVDGVAAGVPDAVLKSDENLAAFCETCNLGIGGLTVSPRLLIALLMRRAQREGGPP